MRRLAELGLGAPSRRARRDRYFRHSFSCPLWGTTGDRNISDRAPSWEGPRPRNSGSTVRAPRARTVLPIPPRVGVGALSLPSTLRASTIPPARGGWEARAPRRGHHTVFSYRPAMPLRGTTGDESPAWERRVPARREGFTRRQAEPGLGAPSRRAPRDRHFHRRREYRGRGGPGLSAQPDNDIDNGYQVVFFGLVC